MHQKTPHRCAVFLVDRGTKFILRTSFLVRRCNHLARYVLLALLCP